MLCASFVVQSISERLFCLNASVCKNFPRPMVFLCKRRLSDSKSFLARRTAKMSFRGDEKGWSVLGWDENSWEELTLMTCGMRWGEMRRAEMRWEELTWFEVRWSVECEVQVWSAKCRVWSVHCEVWGKCSLGVALRRGRAQVMFLDNICATASHKARTHGPGWRTAHANSIDEKGLIDSYSISLRQLPPRLVRVLWVYTHIHIYNYVYNYIYI